MDEDVLVRSCHRRDYSAFAQFTVQIQISRESLCVNIERDTFRSPAVTHWPVVGQRLDPTLQFQCLSCDAAFGQPVQIQSAPVGLI